jgi:hypothetical protein
MNLKNFHLLAYNFSKFSNYKKFSTFFKSPHLTFPLLPILGLLKSLNLIFFYKQGIIKLFLLIFHRSGFILNIFQLAGNSLQILLHLYSKLKKKNSYLNINKKNLNKF